MCLIVEPSMEIVLVIGSLLGAPEVPRALRKRRERWLNGRMMKVQILRQYVEVSYDGGTSDPLEHDFPLPSSSWVP